MKAFAYLFEKLDQNPKPDGQVEALGHYFQVAEDADKVWTIALLSDTRPKRLITVEQLTEWSLTFAKIPHWLYEQSYQAVGDVAETLALLLPKPVEQGKSTITDWVERIISWKGRTDEELQEEITEAWKELNARERFVFNKLITGGFRMTIQPKVMAMALALATHKSETAIAQRLQRNWRPATSSFESLFYADDPLDEWSAPFPLQAAKPLVDDPATLGEPTEWLAEYKWDGIRAQIVRREAALFIWTRAQELITAKLPEFSAFEALPSGTVIDGEILAFQEGNPLSKKILLSRLGRKSVTKKLLKEAPVTFYAFDILEHNGMDVRKKTMEERRALLEKLIKDQPLEKLKLSPSLTFESWEQLATIKKESRSKKVEGLLLKKKTTKYIAKGKKGDWWKWMMEPLKVTAVLLYATTKDGGRANLFSEYTFAVWADDQLIPFTKTSKGLSDHQVMELSLFVRKHTLERFGPVRSVKPELVFELAFDTITASTRHKCGFTLRGARVIQQLMEAKAQSADTLEDLKAMLEKYGQ